MTTEWVTVEPLVDTPDQQEYWRGIPEWTPKVGDRVRVRLSGECRQVFSSALDYNDGPVVGLLPTTPTRHVDEEHGLTGIVDVVLVANTLFRGKPIPSDITHCFCVVFDEPLDGRWKMWGGTYAACELELLS